jgi:selenocysteine lyase/cysteine desulfurase
LITLNFLENNIYHNDDYKKKQMNMINSLYHMIKLNNNLTLISNYATKTILSFYHNNIHANDLAEIFSFKNVCLRTGDLCSPFKIKNNTKGIIRISFGCYNNDEDFDAIKKLINII